LPLRTLQHLSAPLALEISHLPSTRHYCTNVLKGSSRLRQWVYNLGAVKHGRIALYLTKHPSIKFLFVSYICHRKYVYCKILIYILGIHEQEHWSHDPCSLARERCASANALYNVYLPSRLNLQQLLEMSRLNSKRWSCTLDTHHENLQYLIYVKNEKTLLWIFNRNYASK
jgi:hypothetical protein